MERTSQQIIQGFHKSLRPTAVFIGALFLVAVLYIPIASAQTQTAPYLQSSVISGVSFDWSTHRRLAPGSDNWPITWADDGHQYSHFGDGGGFGGTNNNGRVSFGVARIEGASTSYTGFNRYGGLSSEFPSSIDGKSYGIVSIGGILYSWVTPLSDTAGYGSATLYKSTNHAQSWSPTNVQFVQSQGVGIPTIAQFGQDYSGARDGYVYHYFLNLTNTGTLGIQAGGDVVLARSLVADLETEANYEWYTGVGPTWSTNIANRVPVFHDANGIGWNLSVSYNPFLGRYLLTTEHTTSFQGKIGIFDALDPWGPWTTVLYQNNFGSPTITADTFFWNFANKWNNGENFVMVFSGINANDSWNTVQGKFIVTSVPTTTPDTTAPTTPSALTATAISSSQINLSWTASTDAVGVIGYRVYRSGVLVASPTGTTYSDSGLSSSTTYSYTVAAYDAAGNTSAQSASMSATTQTSTPTTINNGQVGYWSFDLPDISGVTAYDRSGLANNGTLTNGPAQILGKIAEALQFDGINDNVNLGAPASLDLSTNFSISAWVKVTAFSSLAGIVGRGGGVNPGTIIIRSGTGGCVANGFTFRINDGSNNAEACAGNKLTGTWYHLVMVVGARGAAGLDGYVNGIKEVSLDTSAVGAINFSTDKWYIGFNQRNVEYLNGSVDDVRIYNRVLSTTEIQSLYNMGSVPTTTPDTTPPTVSLSAPVSGSTVSGSAVVVSATVSDNIGVSGVQFKLDGSNLGVEDTTSPYSTTWNTTTATNGSRILSATARDAAGNTTTSVGVIVSVNNVADITAPTTPTTLSATAISSSQINLSWTASIDNIGVTGYRVFRNGTQIATPSTTSYSDTALTASTAYSYTVAAYDAVGNVSVQSASVSATTQVSTTPSTKFALSNRVQVVTGTLNVRSTPSTAGTLLGTQPVGALGTVIGGPTNANGLNWWNINYDSGVDGWSVEDNLLKVTVTPPAQSPLDSLQAGQWYEAPNSKLSSVYPSPLPPGDPIDIMLAWNGGAFDTARNNLIIWGGGHGNYGGNEIYTFNIDTLTWARPWGPSPSIPSPVPSACNETYGDGNPASRHSYSSMEYIPSVDRFFSQGGSLWCQNGSPSGATWLFNFSSGAWTRQVDVSSGSGGTGHLGSLAVYDPVTQHVFNQRLTMFEEYDPATNTYTTRGNVQNFGSGGWWEDRMSAAIDPVLRRFVAVGSGFVRIWDLDTFIFHEYQSAQIGGDGVVVNSDAPGFQYDPTINKFVAWRGGADIYTFDVTTLAFTKISPAATNTVIPPTPTSSNPQTSKGTYGKFRYVPSKGVYVMAHMTTQNVFFYKLSTAPGGVSPDTTAPTTPSALTATGISSSQINLSWTASTDAVGVTGYRVERCQGSGCTTFAQIVTATITTYSDTTLTASTAYSYRIRAIDAAGNLSGYSASASATTQTPPIVSTKFSLNDRVQVTTTLNVRATASATGSLLGSQSTNALGTIIGGPTNSGGFNWWNVNYDTGVDGWSAEDYLVAYTATFGLSIPLQTWVVRSLPGCATAPCQNIKDMRGLYNSVAKKSYFFGGDHSGTSGYAALYSYTPLSDTWAKVHDVCTPQGTEQPAHPDEGTFVYDSLQQYFWWIPGFSHPGNGDGCGSTLGYFITMSYNISTGLWTSSNYPEPPTYSSEIGIYGVYDPVTHTIIRLLGNNGMPSRQTYDIATNTWSTKSFPGMPTPSGQSSVSTSPSVIDVQNRKVYALDPFYDVLWVYDIAADTLAVQSNVPFHISAYSVEWGGQFNMRLYWDSVNKVLLFPQINGNEGLVRLHAYKPSTNTWEVQKSMTTQPAGITVRGNSGVFDPDQNVLIFYGGSGTPNPYLFLYRYGTGSSTDPTPAPDTTLPVVSLSTPTNGSTVSASVTVSATASDNIGVSGVQFLLDGSNLGTEDTTAPYSITWNTTSATNGIHTLSARARDAAGNQTTSASVTITTSNIIVTPDTTPPTTPTSLTVSAFSSSQINLSWIASTDTVGVTGYRVYRGGTQIATPSTTSYSDTALNPSTAYSYTVAAYDAAGNTSAQSTGASATTQTPPIVSTKFSLNDRVQVTTTLNVRATASATGSLLGSQSTNALGTIIGGPTNSGGFNWWNVNYDTGVDGWSVEDYLVTYTGPIPPSSGRIINATPSNYVTLLSSGLIPGDTLVLSAGSYTGMSLYNLNGTSDAFITITGPSSGPPAVILGSAGNNTLRIANSSYVTIKNLEVDSRNLGGDAVNGQSTSHHITLDNLYIHGCNDDQQTVGISTNQAETWNWVIRNSTITDCGTGMYLGDSTGNSQFLSGLIENNLIYDTIGYNIEIKHQNALPTNIPGFPLTKVKTIIRNNVFSKANNASFGSLARPNLLVGHMPLSGAGQDNYYEIYSNFFYQNPTGEPLFQGEGNYAFYDNLLFNSVQPSSALAAILAQPHNDRPRDIRIFNNTVVAPSVGVSVSGGYTTFQQKVIGNAVFSANSISASDQQGNITGTYASASIYLNNPFGPLGSLDLFPKSGQLTGTTLDTSSYANIYTDWNKDFNNVLRTEHITRGAYFGSGTNPGWLPNLSIKATSTVILPTPDTTPPTISLSTPTTGSTVSGTTVTLSATASDNTGVSGVQFLLDGIALGAEDTTTPYSVTWNTTTATNAPHTLSARARDAAGNQTTAATITVTVANITTPTPDTTPPSIPTSLSATAFSSTQINLAWTASTDNVGVTGYRVERCQGNGCTTFAQIATPATNSYFDTGRTASTAYVYRIRAVDAAGNLSPYSITASATTQALSVSTKFVANDRVQTTATPSLNVRSAPSLTGTLLGTQPTGSLGTVIGGPTNANGFNWWNINYDTGVDGWSVEDYLVTYTAPTADTIAPTTPINLSTTPASSSQINLSWTASTDAVGVTGYRLERCQGSGCTTFAQIATPTITSYSDTLLTASTAYVYRIRALDAAGNLSGYSTTAIGTTLVAPDTLAPTISLSTPTAGSTVTGITVTLSATASDNTGVTGVQFLLDGIALGAEDTTTPYSVTWNTTTATNAPHTLSARARDAAGNQTTSAPITVTVANITTPTPDTAPPSTPTSLSATPSSSSAINLSWIPSSDNVAVSGYRIYRNGTQITTVTTSAYSNTGLSPSTSYTYTVSAYDAAGNASAQSTGASGSTQSAPVVTTTPPSPPPSTITNTPPASGATGSINTTPTTTTTPTVSTPTPSTPTSSLSLTRNLYRGTKGTDVQSLQSFLIQQNYLAPTNNTGYYGTLTQKAVEKYQCARNLICSGTEVSTGYGVVGPKTRTALNSSTVSSGITTSFTTNLTPAQVDAILSVLESFGAEQAVIEQVKRSLGR